MCIRDRYLTFEHDEFTMKPTLDENGRLMLREDYRIATLKDVYKRQAMRSSCSTCKYCAQTSRTFCMTASVTVCSLTVSYTHLGAWHYLP